MGNFVGLRFLVRSWPFWNRLGYTCSFPIASRLRSIASTNNERFSTSGWSVWFLDLLETTWCDLISVPKSELRTD